MAGWGFREGEWFSTGSGLGRAGFEIMYHPSDDVSRCPSINSASTMIVIAKLLKYSNGQVNMFYRYSRTFLLTGVLASVRTTYEDSDTARDTINCKRSPSLPIKVACIAVKFQTKSFSSIVQ